MLKYFKFWVSKEISEAIISLIVLAVVVILILIVRHFEKRRQ